MIIVIDNHEINVPDSITDLTLRDRIEYDVHFGDDLNKLFDEIVGDKEMDEPTRELKLAELYIDRVHKTVAFFGECEIDDVQKIRFDGLSKLYETHLKQFIEIPKTRDDGNSFLINDILYWLPDTSLLPSTEITFIEFITSREVTRNMSSTSSEKLTAIAYIGAIFFRPDGDKFDETKMDPNSGLVEMIMDLPFITAIQIGLWFDEWIESIAKSFSVFDPSKSKSGINMTSHFEKWGWISFMNYVAKYGTIFYKSNDKTNLDNIKSANLYDVLMWASCERDHDEIVSLYHDEQERKARRSH